VSELLVVVQEVGQGLADLFGSNSAVVFVCISLYLLQHGSGGGSSGGGSSSSSSNRRKKGLTCCPTNRNKHVDWPPTGIPDFTAAGAKT